MTYQYVIQSFNELTTLELLEIFRARMQVFVVEQNCVYQDVDGLDSHSYHLRVTKDEALVGYVRIIPPSATDNHKYSVIGRVLMLPEHRRQKVAWKMMQHAIDYCHRHYPNHAISLSAQTYLTNFYESLGFKCRGKAYLMDNIEHIDMYLPPV